MRARIAWTSLLLAGCTALPPAQVSAPTPGPIAQASVATAAPPTSDGGGIHTPVSPWPSVPPPGVRPAPVPSGPRAEALEPEFAPDGARASVRLTGFPAGAAIELWHMGRQGPFRFGYPHPSEVRGATKVGIATTTADGRATVAFEVPAVDDFMSTHFLWAVLPGGVVVGNVHGWSSSFPTTVEGAVLDEAGRPVDGGTATIVVGGGPGSVTGSFARSARIRDGRYRIDEVPMPLAGTLTLRRNGWPDRVRPFDEHEVHRRWAAEGGDFEPGGTAWQASVVRHRGRPVAFAFGGAASTVDPLAPLYFFSLRANEAAYRTTALAGRVYDAAGAPVQAAEGAVVKALVAIPGEPDAFLAEVPVRDGRYAFASVPTTGPVQLRLMVPPRCSSVQDREVVALPTALSGREAIADFGGPDAPGFPFRRPDPMVPDPCVGMPGVPAPQASAPAP